MRGTHAYGYPQAFPHPARQAAAASAAAIRAVGRSFTGIWAVPATSPTRTPNLPGEAVGAPDVEYIAAARGAQERADLMAEEGDAGQDRKETQAENLHDPAIHQRDNPQPQRAHGDAEQDHRERRGWVQEENAKATERRI